MDAVDFKFVFKFNEKKTVLEIQPRTKGVPREVETYAETLIAIYKKQLGNPQ